MELVGVDVTLGVAPLVEHAGALCAQIYKHWLNMKHLKQELAPFKTLVETVRFTVDQNGDTMPANVLGTKVDVDKDLVKEPESRIDTSS